MKRVWYRAVAISAPGGLRASEVAELGRRRRRLAKSPLSRGATRDLVRYHVRLGDLEAARRLATRWLAKDRMDASALIELAGIAALAGERRRSLDLLASAVDADPTSVAAHTRMLNLYGALGNRDMRCAHALTRALVAPKSWRHQVAAARCDQDIQRHMANLSPRRRRRALRVLARRTKPPRLWGRLKVLATWSSGPDLDIVVVSPRGRVISWLGGARKVRTAAVRSALREVLAISMEETGRYQIWMVPEAGKRAVVSGSVRVGSYGKTRSFRFTASGRPVRVAEVRLRWRSRLVPAPWRGHGPIR